MDAPPRKDAFDIAVISEVLEHLEEPARALGGIRTALRPGGSVFINAPVNSPAPDHIYLWRSTDELLDFVREQGLAIDRVALFPQTGISLERARAKALSISCVIIARKPVN
jgi:hypothetical protein